MDGRGLFANRAKFEKTEQCTPKLRGKMTFATVLEVKIITHDETFLLRFQL